MHIFSTEGNKVFMKKRLHITRWRNDPCITHSTQINFKLTRFAKNKALEEKFDWKHYFPATFFKDRFSFFLIKYDSNNSALPKVPMSEKKKGISIYDDLIQTVCSNLSYWFLFYFTVISNFLCRYNLSLIRDNYFLFPFRKVFEDINFIHCLLYDHNVIIICQLCVNALWNTCKITTIQTPTL